MTAEPDSDNHTASHPPPAAPPALAGKQHTRNTIGTILAGIALASYWLIPAVHTGVDNIWRSFTGATPTSATSSGYYSVTGQDAVYLSQLAQAGVPYPGGPEAAIHAGKDIAKLYDQGHTSDQLVYAYQVTEQRMGTIYTPDQVKNLVYVAITNYATRR